jgi:hypothetical protein
MWKEAVVAWFKVLYQYLPEGTQDNHKRHSVHNLYGLKDLKAAFKKYYRIWQSSQGKSKKRENGQKNEMKIFSLIPKETYLLFKLKFKTYLK